MPCKRREHQFWSRGSRDVDTVVGADVDTQGDAAVDTLTDKDIKITT